MANLSRSFVLNYLNFTEITVEGSCLVCELAKRMSESRTFSVGEMGNGKKGKPES